MKTLSFILTTAIITMFSMHMLFAQANDYTILNIHESTVKKGQNVLCYEVVNHWKTCTLENEDNNNWAMWLPQQEAANGYTLPINIDKWAVNISHSSTYELPSESII